jgi:hypothetical protein
MTSKLTTKTRGIDVEEAQWDPKTGKAPFVERTIFADERIALNISGHRAARDVREIVRSRGFNDLLERYEQFFSHAPDDLEKMLEKRKIDQSQRITDPEKFRRIFKQIAEYEGASPIEISKDDFEKHLHSFRGLLNYWLGLRSSLQLDAIRENDKITLTTAQEEERNFLAAIQDLIAKINTVAESLESEERIDTEEGMYLGAIDTIVGGTRDSVSNVFRVLDGEKGVNYGKGLNIETIVKRRTSGAPIELMEDNNNTHVSIKKRPAHENEILESEEWIMRTYNVGGLPIAVYFNSKYGSHLLPGLEALFGEMDNGNVVGIAPVKLYFGVDPELMTGGKQRIVYSRHRELRMLISAEENMDYFGYLKKSILTAANLWSSMLSGVMSRKHYLDEETPEKNSEMMRNFPEELRGLFTELMEFQGKKPMLFEQTALPQTNIQNIRYLTRLSGFNPGRYIFMPVHGASYTIDMGSGKEMNFVLPGDSGVGKSEVLRELKSKGIEVSNIQADDMLYMIYDKNTGKTYSVGTESGAFTKTDDLPADSKINTSDKRPLVGYNAEESGGNRRVVEPSVAKPLIPKRIDGFLALVNAFEPDDESQRVKKIDLQDLVETWIEGPYKKSSSVTGGGSGGEIVNVPFWNEFGPDKVTHMLRHLMNEMFINEPENGNTEIVDRNRKKIKAFMVNTYCKEDSDLNGTFGAAADQLQAELKKAT